MSTQFYIALQRIKSTRYKNLSRTNFLPTAALVSPPSVPHHDFGNPNRIFHAHCHREIAFLATSVNPTFCVALDWKTLLCICALALLDFLSSRLCSTSPSHHTCTPSLGQSSSTSACIEPRCQTTAETQVILVQ